MISGGSNINSNDGDSFYGILSCMRGNEFLRGDSYNKPTIGDTSSGARYSRICVGGILSGESNAKPIF